MYWRVDCGLSSEVPWHFILMEAKEMWMVNGEVCIGLFALRDIKKGEELTFDYNYVRVFGAAVKQCVCGSSKCRGYIGGDPLNAELIVQDDSDEEYPEPVMICEDGEIDDYLVNVLANSSFGNSAMQITENPTKNIYEMNGPAATIGHQEATMGTQIVESLFKDENENEKSMTSTGHLRISTENEDFVNGSASVVSKPQASVGMEDSVGKLLPSGQVIQTTLELDDVASKSTNATRQEISVAEEILKNPLCSAQQSETSSLTIMHEKFLPHVVDIKRKSKYDMEGNKHFTSKSCLPMRTPSSSSVRKRKPKNYLVHVSNPLDSKFHLLQSNSRKFSGSSLGGRFEAVEEKLNELLDVDGGISKRKDASRGYLKLLLLTAASGDNGNGEAIQSNRDLSMILDALLKTKSRTVLVDIINKNGLQMLHNIMKRYRKEFNKIPILRKLLKVLEYLAVREILTWEHINGGPLCPGVESFRESILELTDHLDKQVHQIARNFRDKWIPRPVRKRCCMDRDDGRIRFHQASICNKLAASGKDMEKNDCIKQSMPATTSVDANILEGCFTSCVYHVTNKRMTRKRKSRWDQPAGTDADPRSLWHKEPCILPNLLEMSHSSPQPEEWQTETNMAENIKQNTNEDAPPGFSPLLDGRLVPPNSSSTDHYQGNVSPVRCPYEVVTGYPQERFFSCLSVSYGIPSSVVKQFGIPQAVSADSWIVAPGMPFHPFPPLPPYPHNRRNPPHAGNSISTSQLAERAEQDWHNSAAFSDQTTPSTSGATTVGIKNHFPNNGNNFQQLSSSSCSLGRKYFRQQKWTNSKLGPQIGRRTEGMGNNIRNGICNVNSGSVTNELEALCSSEEASTGLETSGSTLYKHSQRQN